MWIFEERMPSILQGCTQAMSSACTAIMIAEMLGVKSRLGWYMTWQTGWASDEPLGALDAFTRMNMQDEILSI